MVHGNPIFQAPPIFKGFPLIFRFAFFLSRTWIAWWRSFNPSWKLRRKCICRSGFGVMIGFHKWLRNKNCLLKQTHLQSCGMESMNYRDKLPSLVGHIKKNTHTHIYIYVCIKSIIPQFNNCLFFMLGKSATFANRLIQSLPENLLQEMRLRKEMVWDLGRISGMEENLGQSI